MVKIASLVRTMRARQLQAKQSLPMSPMNLEHTVHFAFAHTAIPILALFNSKKFHTDAFSERGTSYLLGIWKGLNEKMRRTESSVGLRSQIIPLANSLEALLINLPAPENTGEAFAIACITRVSRGIFSTSVEKIRCFTLEKGASSEFFVCEWTSPQPKPARVNHGKIDSSDPQAFMTAVGQLLSGRRLSNEPTAPTLDMSEEAGSQVQNLLRQNVEAMMAIPEMTPKEAEEASRNLVNAAWERAAKRGDDVYRKGRGDDLLARQHSDIKIKEALSRLRAEGVTDSDIRWWWNMSSLEREVIIGQDEMNRASLFIYLRRSGVEGEEAAREVFRRHGRFGDPDTGEGEDRPLPFELKGRIVAFIEKHMKSPAALQQLVSRHSSFNALVREQVRMGQL